MASINALYHLAEADNLDSILEQGLLSTEKLVGLAAMNEDERQALLRRQRPRNVRLPGGVLIRDQAPMPPAALTKALDDGLQPSDWYALLNSFVFLWADRDRMDRQRQACGDRPQIMLTFDREALLDRFGPDAFVSPINSGNARRKPARRGLNTLMPYEKWQREGWPTGQRTRPPAEFLFSCAIPAQAPFLLSAARV